MQNRPHGNYDVRNQHESQLISNVETLIRRVSLLALATVVRPAAVPLHNSGIFDALEILSKSMPKCLFFTGSEREPILTPMRFLAHECPEALVVKRCYIIPKGDEELLQAVCDSVAKHTLSVLLLEIESDLSLTKRQVERLVAELLNRLFQRNPTLSEIGKCLSQLR